MPHADITIDMDRACTRCGKKGATEGGWCLDCISKYKLPAYLKDLNMKDLSQPKLIPMSEKELAELKDKLSGMVGEYLQLEEEKKAADQDWNERMGKLWEEIKLQRAKIEGAG